MTTTCPRCDAPVGAGSEACLACGARLPAPATAAPTSAGARPTGVTLLALAYFAAAALAVLLGVLAIVGGAFIGALIAEGAGAGVGAVLGAFLGVIAFVIAALAVVGGVGLWTGRKWGWFLALAVSGLYGLGDLARLAIGDVTAVVGLAVNGLIVWYLLQPVPKKWFHVA